jgi:hypothetical protein
MTDNKYINSVINKISWKTIRDYYAVNKIEWNFLNENQETIKKIPSIVDLQNDFINAANMLISKNLTSMDYGNWVLFWTNPELAKEIGIHSAQLEAFFVLTGALTNNLETLSSKDLSLEDLNEKMQLALDEEDYIMAGQIKKQIEQIEKTN